MLRSEAPRKDVGGSASTHEDDAAVGGLEAKMQQRVRHVLQVVDRLAVHHGDGGMNGLQRGRHFLRQ